jgi:hypothetical protein
MPVARNIVVPVLKLVWVEIGVSAAPRLFRPDFYFCIITVPVHHFQGGGAPALAARTGAELGKMKDKA